MSTKPRTATPKRPNAGHVAPPAKRPANPHAALSPRQKKFCEGILAKLTAAEAYAAAYPQCSPAVASSGGSRMVRLAKIKREIAKSNRKIDTATVKVFAMERAEWLGGFQRIAGKAEDSEDYSAATGALRQIGLAMPKWYAPEAVEHSGKVEMTLKDTLRKLQEKR